MAIKANRLLNMIDEAPDSQELAAPNLYLNRELSQLEFNRRVLAQAQDSSIPLLERLRYLCISCTNLDEFFEIRVASVRAALEYGAPLPPDGLSPATALNMIHQAASQLVADQYQCWNDNLRPELNAAGLRILPPNSWNAEQKKWLREYFDNEIMPVLTPMGLDPAHPFPRILNKSLNVVVVLEGRDAFGRAGGLAIVRAPRSLPRIIHLPQTVSGGENDFVLLSAALTTFVDDLFPGLRVKGAWQFRVTRNSELFVDEDEVENLANALKDELVNRGFRHAVRLEIADNCPDAIVKTLLQNFALSDNAVYRINGPVNLNRVTQVYDLVDRPDLKFKNFNPRLPKFDLTAPFKHLRRQDVLMHHPYESFSALLDFVQIAAHDPKVLAIKQTLYRVGKDSALVDHLITAARNGKDVTVVVELRARFDEEANIRLADRLQEAGVQVVYGVVGFKTHAKMLLIVRREGRKLQRYVHLGTGNYHAGTAKLYTDFGLLSANDEVAADVHDLFQQLSGLAPNLNLRHLLSSPFSLHQGILDKINREADNARTGRPARIIARMNALNEPNVIRALYKASQAGVSIDLIVRGACGLRPGVVGISDNIRVRSVIGRFLEHSRVYWFANNGNPEIFCSSADWMERNLIRRVETCFPILDPNLAQRVYQEALEGYLHDNTNTWTLDAAGNYSKIVHNNVELSFCAQDDLLKKFGF